MTRFRVLGIDIDIDTSYVAESDAVVRQQLAAYERGERRTFDLTVSTVDGLAGEVMTVMRSIPYGQTTTYGAVAAELDTAPVAVGQACGRNPVPIVVPCHRVVGADSLGGYSAADGPATKRRLLDHESGRTRLDTFA